MDPGTLAAGVAAAVLWVLKQGGTKLVDRAADAAVDEMWERLRPLYELLRERVVPGSAAAAALDAARRDPGDPTVEPALRQHLRALLAEEPSLALELTSRLAQAGTVTVEGNTAYIEIHAPVTNSIIIGGTVNQTVDIRIELPRTLDQPRQLKAPTRGFVGRRADGRRALHELQPRAKGVPIVMVTGPPGIGKTEFAYWVASAIRDQGRSGIQLMVRLSAGGASPRAPEDALVELLLALGVPLDEVPPGEPARQARYAAMLEGRRPLILLDDAADARQVEALLPPSGGMVIVTSRRELRELLADRVMAIRLKPLTTPQALHLLAQRVGLGRVGGDLLAARQIVDACGRFPLAVAIAAGRIASASEEHVPLRELANRLQETRLRLAHLKLGERSVKTPIAVSYQLLTEPQRHVLHVAAVLNAPELDVEVVADAGGISRQDARRLLDELVNLHLLEVTGPPGDRWRLHQLVDDYAYEQAVRRLTAEQRAEIVTRAVRIYAGRARTLKQLLASHAAKLDPELAAWARAQLAQQRANLHATLRAAVRLPVLAAVVVLRAIIEALLAIIVGWPDAVPAFESILQVARDGQDQLLEAKALYGLALHRERIGDPAGALRLLRRSLDLASTVGDDDLVRRARQAIVRVQGQLGAPDPRVDRMGTRYDAGPARPGPYERWHQPPPEAPAGMGPPQGDRAGAAGPPPTGARTGPEGAGAGDGPDAPRGEPPPHGGPTRGPRPGGPPPGDGPGQQWPRDPGGPPPTGGTGGRSGQWPPPDGGWAAAAASAAAAPAAEHGPTGSGRSHLHDVVEAADVARGDRATPGRAVFG